ncbi:hypothetical protein Celaphus_00013527, partial [Cervus elaphus hippelaphus]
ATTLIGCMVRLIFCDANTINHYLCDIYPLLQLSCTGTYIIELEVIIVSGINITVPSLTIFISYGLILTNILHIKSTEGRSKAFSTCSSHIIAVSLFFGSSAFVYLKPSSVSADDGKISSVFYTNVISMMNPLIYSLRNKDVKLALRKTLRLFCISTPVNELVLSIVVGINIIFVSYGLIFSSILHIKPMEGRSKALSTCSSHIIAVSLFFGSGAFVNLKPSAGPK